MTFCENNMVDRKWGWTTLESGCTSYRKPAYIQKFFIDLKYFFEEHLPPKCFLAHKMRIIHTLVVSNFLQD
ncbi:hypothetical protein DZK34_01580 [Chlamydia abortus]|nr:hypothetical protein DZK34_01580 [Chlamydia abortus]